MNPEMLARWQFASTTIYHFIIVPLSIGLTVLVALMQTFAYRRRGTGAGEIWDRASRFWARIMLVIFALGIVTGIVQEFQFGMNWSAYSRFVGDIFGAPLAMEALVAFFLESTFLGLWIFGRDLLSKRVHLATIWLAAAGTVTSAYFILAANSFMQHPVGLAYNPAKHRVELTSIWKVLTNSTQLVTFPHTIFGAMLTGGGILLSVSAWHLRQSALQRAADPASVVATDPVHRSVAKLAVVVIVLAGVSVSVVGHIQGQVMTRQQPMKMAAAEALFDGRTHAPFSLLAYANVSEGHNKLDIAIPDGLSLLATDRPGNYVAGINDVQAAEVKAYGPGSYIPVVWIAYWCFRLMIGFGALALLLACAVALSWRRGTLWSSPRLLRAATWTVALPLLANTAGWLFTETARQPWLVYGLLKTKAGVSTNVGSGYVLTTLIGFTALYGVLGVICFRMVRRIAMAGPEAIDNPTADPDSSDLSRLILV